jgi:ferrous iron transport protein B
MYAPEEPMEDTYVHLEQDMRHAGEESAGDTRLQKALLRSVTPAAALAYMVFILLYFPCIATFVAIKKESGGWKWAIFTAVYTIALAWVAAFVTFRIALLCGL